MMIEMENDRDGEEADDEERKKLPIDFFETEFLSNKPDPRLRDRDLGNLEPG